MRLCTIDGCGRQHLARGWCATHYQRWRVTGEPGGAGLLRVPGKPGATRKRCKACGETKPVDAFYRDKRNSDGLMSHCKACTLSRQKPGRIQRKYGLDPREHEALQTAQGGQCPICGEERSLVVDHCHRSGKVRALLCDRCNRLLGVVDDNAALLQAAITYLHQHQTEELSCPP